MTRPKNRPLLIPRAALTSLAGQNEARLLVAAHLAVDSQGKPVPGYEVLARLPTRPGGSRYRTSPPAG
jgi:hypothetical protein